MIVTKEVLATIEFIGPNIASLVAPTQVPIPCLVTKEGGLDLVHAMKARELVSGAIFLGDVMALQCMSMEEALTSLHFYATRVYGTSLESHSHNFCLILISSTLGGFLFSGIGVVHC